MRTVLCPLVVGRDEELGVLREALARAREGSGGVVFLLGEAGLGKSRLVGELCRLAAEWGVPVLAGRAVERSAPGAFQPLGEAVRSRLRSTRPPADPLLEPFLPVLDALLGDRLEEGLAGRSPRSAVAEAVTRLLATVGRRHGALLVLEDLQWSDPETLDAVEYLADRLAAVPALCVATVRSGEASEAEAWARRFAERRIAGLVELSPLETAATVRMVERCLGAASVPDELGSFITTHAEGVPLFVEELLAGLCGAGALVRQEAGWRVVRPLVPQVPVSFAATVRHRLAALEETDRHVVTSAAVLGRRFDWSLLPGITGLDGDAVLASLRRATGAQILTAEPEAQGFRFRHALSRQAVVEDLLPPERAAVAGRAMDAVEAAHPGLPGQWCLLAAELAEAAGRGTRAAELLVEGARRALGRGAVTSAEAALRRARRLARGDPDVALEVADLAARATALAGRVDRAVELARGVLVALAGRPASEVRRAQLHLALARAGVAGGRWGMARQHVGEARGLATAAGDEGLGAHAAAVAAQVAIARGRLEEAGALAGSAVAAAGRARVPAAACEAHEVLGRLARPRDVWAAEEHFEAARRTAETHGLRLWRARALHELGTIDLFTTLSRGRLLAAREAAVEAGAVRMIAMVDLHLATVGLARWEPEGAVAAAERCVDLSRRLELDTLGMALIHLASAHGMAGRQEAMEEAVAQALEVAGDDVEVAAGVPGRARLKLALRRADLVRARRLLDDAMAILRRKPSVAFPFRGLWALLRAVQHRDGEVARSQARRSAGGGAPINVALVDLAEAVALGRIGRGAEAERVVARELLSDTTRLGRSEIFRTLTLRIVAGPALNDGWGDPCRWLREALVVFDASDLVELASSCRALLREAGEPVPRRGRGDSQVPPALGALGVTSREVDVLALLRENLTNRQVAARLHLSPRTVERHVANLLTKTGATDRHALADLAADAGVPAAGI